jgi:hypothetical protein
MHRVRNEGVRGSSPLSSTQGSSPKWAKHIPNSPGFFRCRLRHDEGRLTTGQAPFAYPVALPPGPANWRTGGETLVPNRGDPYWRAGSGRG